MSKTPGFTEEPPVNGVPLIPTLIPPVEVNREFPDLSFAASSWYCHRVFTAGFQQAPALVLHATGAAHPAVPQLASAGGALAIGPTIRNDATINNATGPDQRLMTDPLPLVGRSILLLPRTPCRTARSDREQPRRLGSPTD